MTPTKMPPSTKPKKPGAKPVEPSTRKPSARSASVNAAMHAKHKAVEELARSPLVPDEIIPAPGTELSPELTKVQRAIDMTAELGKSLAECCRRLKFPYARAYVLINQHPELVKRWNNARAYYIQTKVEEMEKIARTTKDVQRARLLCDNIKWEAQRVARHIYGDEVIIKGDSDAPIVMQLVAGANDLVKKIRGQEQ